MTSRAPSAAAATPSHLRQCQQWGACMGVQRMPGEAQQFYPSKAQHKRSAAQHSAPAQALCDAALQLLLQHSQAGGSHDGATRRRLSLQPRALRH